jgi:anti-sigma factor RsiW
LQAYVDGALEGARALEVETALRQDAEIRRRVHLYAMLNHVIRMLYDAVLTEPAPEALRRVADKRRRH